MRFTGAWDRRSIVGWIIFCAVGALWPPLWFGVVLDVAPDGIAFGAGFGLCVSGLCLVMRLLGFPRVAWAALLGLGAATVVWSLAMNFGGGPDDPWAGNYQIFALGMMTIDLPAAVLVFYLAKRKADKIRSQGNSSANS